MAAEQFNPGAAASAPKRATVSYGIHRDNGNYVGMTIAQFREKNTRKFSIEPGSTFYKNKEQLSEDYVIQDGDVIVGHKKLGEKGI